MSNSTCSVAVCDRIAIRNGLCDGHYHRKLRGQRMDTPIRARYENPGVCVTEGCNKTERLKRGLCPTHYYKAMSEGDLESSPCEAQGCAKFAVSRGLCPTHYSRWLRTGKTTTTRVTLEQAFTSRTATDGDHIIWTGPKTKTGYGRLSAEGQKWGAHIYSWVRARGAVPDGLEVNHVCHRRDCVNVDHLELLTHQQNSAYRKGAQANNRAGFRGVSPHKSGKWQATVQHKSKRYYLGLHDTPEAAAEAARAKREELHQRPDFDGAEAA